MSTPDRTETAAPPQAPEPQNPDVNGVIGAGRAATSSRIENYLGFHEHLATEGQ